MESAVNFFCLDGLGPTILIEKYMMNHTCTSLHLRTSQFSLSGE
jgi:hypothetical protein